MQVHESVEFNFYFKYVITRDDDLREDEIDQIVDGSPEFFKEREEGDGHEEPEGILPDLPPNAGKVVVNSI